MQKNDFLLSRDPQKGAKMVAIFTVIDASNYKTHCIELSYFFSLQILLQVSDLTACSKAVIGVLQIDEVLQTLIFHSLRLPGSLEKWSPNMK
jgi:hypothetical protein